MAVQIVDKAIRFCQRFAKLLRFEQSTDSLIEVVERVVADCHEQMQWETAVDYQCAHCSFDGSHVASVSLDIAAPFGLDDLFAMVIRPNYALDNAASHTRKAERARLIWPQVTVIPWHPTPGEWAPVAKVRGNARHDEC